MNKKYFICCVLFILVFTIDRLSKNVFLNGFTWECDFFSLYLVFNKGVAFSMFSFLDEYLKYIQIAILLIAFIFLVKEKKILNTHLYSICIIFSGGAANIIDRFFYAGVVDFFAWHYYFNFAIFNVADVCINIGVALILIKEIILKLKHKSVII